MFFKEKINLKNSLPITIFVFAFLLNQFSGNKGIFPIDSFSHFDIGYRLLNNDLPFRDYWAVSGPFVDLLQAIIFSIFDTSWQTYLLSGSILNGVVAVITYKLLISLKLDKKFSFFYSICFAILAYPVSGTPFVDLHSTYFCIISIYLLIFAIKDKNLLYWFFVPIFLGFAFLSKQVPAAYLGFSIILLIIYDFIFSDKRHYLKVFYVLVISTSSFLALFFIIFYLKDISIISFIDQYINYPREIGNKRYSELTYNFGDIILNFKFINIVVLSLLIVNIFKFFDNKKFYKETNFKIFLILFFVFLSLIQHQILTKNQEFIFFLIPLFSAIIHIELNILKFKYKKYIIYFVLIFCLSITIKYHVRFNIEKKFHELNNVNFKNAVRGSILDKKFKGLNWITPDKREKNEVEDEIKTIKEILEILKNDNQKKMLFTNYSFFSVLLKETTNSPSRWFPGDDSAFPLKESKFYNNYKKFLSKQIKNKEIVNIYFIYDVNEKNLLDYIPLECFEKNKVHEGLTRFRVNDKCDYIKKK